MGQVLAWGLPTKSYSQADQGAQESLEDQGTPEACDMVEADWC